MGDLPDFTQAVSNQGTVIFDGTISSFAAQTFDVSAYQSVTVCIKSNVVGAQVRVLLNWFATNAFTQATNLAFMNGVGLTGVFTVVNAEMPLYGGGFQLLNESTSPCTVRVIGSSRAVPVFHILNDSFGARRLSASGAFTNGIGVNCLALDAGDATIVNNAQSMLHVVSNTTGTLEVLYLDSGGTQVFFPILAVAAAGFQVAIAPLPQGVIGLFFLPSANNAAGLCTVTVAAGQLN